MKLNVVTETMRIMTRREGKVNDVSEVGRPAGALPFHRGWGGGGASSQ